MNIKANRVYLLYHLRPSISDGSTNTAMQVRQSTGTQGKQNFLHIGGCSVLDRPHHLTEWRF